MYNNRLTNLTLPHKPKGHKIGDHSKYGYEVVIGLSVIHRGTRRRRMRISRWRGIMRRRRMVNNNNKEKKSVFRDV